MDIGVLDAFPAEKLIRTRTDTHEFGDWNQHWTKCGGRFYRGEMVASKWDPVWVKISAFSLPFPPFELGSGYEVEDVGRPEAEALGLHLPAITNVNVKIDLDMRDLCRRFLTSLDRLLLTEPQ
jgi:hypothetical protein